MDYDRWLSKEAKKKVMGQEMICRNCKFNFTGICAGHDSHWGYGGKIESDMESCWGWKWSLEFFIEKAQEVEKEHGIKPGSL